MFEPATRKGRKAAASAMTLLVCAAVVLGLSRTALAPPLNNAQTVVLSGGAGSNQWYWIDVPNNTRRLLVRVSGGFGNANMFVRRIGSPPPWWSNITPTNNEQVLVNNPAQGRWLIRVFGAGPFWNASLFAGFERRNGPNWTNAAIRATPGIINGLAQVMANRSNNDDDDDDDEDEDRDRDRRDPDQPHMSAQRTRVTTLRAGEEIRGLNGAAESEEYFRILVPRNAPSLRIATRGGSGACLLLVRRADLPSVAEHDYRSDQRGTEQTVSIERPLHGVYYARLIGDTNYNGVTILADLGQGGGTEQPNRPDNAPADLRIGTLTSGQPVREIAGDALTRRYYMINLTQPMMSLQILTHGGRGNCFLYLRRDALPTLETHDHSSVLEGTEQTLRLHRPAAGTYYLMLFTREGCRNVTLIANASGTGDGNGGEMRILAPAASEALTAGQSYTIRWQAPPATRAVFVTVSWNGGQTWEQLALLPAQTPGFIWLVPDNQTASDGGVLLRVTDRFDPTNTATQTLAFSRS